MIGAIIISVFLVIAGIALVLNEMYIGIFILLIATSPITFRLLEDKKKVVQVIKEIDEVKEQIEVKKEEMLL